MTRHEGDGVGRFGGLAVGANDVFGEAWGRCACCNLLQPAGNGRARAGQGTVMTALYIGSYKFTPSKPHAQRSVGRYLTSGSRYRAAQ